jgi:glyoxylase-like metal-dependent hydrolase (beta-lactamase superfamily II)
MMDMATPGTAKRLWALDAPTVTADASLFMLGASGSITTPLPAYLIEHPRGLVLFDTSIAPEAFSDPEAVYGPIASAFDLQATEDQRLDRQLADFGYQVSDVTHVVLSHAHFDHAGGLHQFSEAKIVVGQGELPFAFWPDPAGAGYYRQADLEPARTFDWHYVPRRDVDLFGDGSVVVLWTPGHTPGELSLLVRLPDRNFVLTGDAVHLRAQLQTPLPMPADWDAHRAVESIHRLRLLRDAVDATVWISHDPEDWAELHQGAACYE